MGEGMSHNEVEENWDMDQDPHDQGQRSSASSWPWELQKFPTASTGAGSRVESRISSLGMRSTSSIRWGVRWLPEFGIKADFSCEIRPEHM